MAKPSPPSLGMTRAGLPLKTFRSQLMLQPGPDWGLTSPCPTPAHLVSTSPTVLWHLALHLTSAPRPQAGLPTLVPSTHSLCPEPQSHKTGGQAGSLDPTLLRSTQGSPGSGWEPP